MNTAKPFVARENASGSQDLDISVEQLMDRLEHHEPVEVLDIRSEHARAEWHIPGSVHLMSQQSLEAYNAPAGAKVVTVCESGDSSRVAALELRDRGVDAQSLMGGMRAWSLAWNLAEIPLNRFDTGIVQLRRTGKGCLSYIVGSQGEAAVVDASLDPQIYQQVAERYGWVITHALDTHIHADHLMRSAQLATRTRATLHLPETQRVSFDFSPMRDGDLIDVGLATIRCLYTPGHTPESMSLVVDDEAILTGDTLFLDGVGRPDLEATREEALQHAHQLFDSLRLLLGLPPDMKVLPGHTSRPVEFDRIPVMAPLSTVRDSIVLLDQPEDDFVEALMARIPETPPNHHRIVEINESGIDYPGDPVDLEAGANRCAIS